MPGETSIALRHISTEEYEGQQRKLRELIRLAHSESLQAIAESLAAEAEFKQHRRERLFGFSRRHPVIMTLIILAATAWWFICYGGPFTGVRR